MVELKGSEYLMIRYSAIPWFGGQFCISVVSSTTSDQLRLVKQWWDDEYDRNRFSSGVYNLDRLCIKKAEIEFSASQGSELMNILDSIVEFPDELDDKRGIVLDGTEYYLNFNMAREKKQYYWKLPTAEIKYFEPLLVFLLSIA